MHVKYLQHQQFGTVQLLTMPLNAGASGTGHAAATATTSSASFLSKKGSEGEQDDSGECEPVPLPIQMFLWRQTNHFIGAKVGKLYEASCVTFERVVVQNILYGLSPSLSEAFNIISRWRFVRASFPHVVQCCGALLAERTNEEETLPMSGSLVKMLYILHWLLIDAANECNEEEDQPQGGASQDPDSVFPYFRRLTYTISSIQLFIYLLAPFFHSVKEEEILGHIRLHNGIRFWEAVWQNRCPDILCFCAPVKQRRKFPIIAEWSNRVGKPSASIIASNVPAATVHEDAGGIYLGDDGAAGRGSVTNRRKTTYGTSTTAKQSAPLFAIPPPKPPRTDISVLREIEKSQKQKLERQGLSDELLEKQQTCSSEERLKENTGDTNRSASLKKHAFAAAPSSTVISQSPSRSRGGSMVRSVSEYKTSEILKNEGRKAEGMDSKTRLEKMTTGSVRRSQTSTFSAMCQDSPDSSSSSGEATIRQIIETDSAMRFDEECGSNFSAMFQIGSSNDAPLVTLHDICSNISGAAISTSTTGTGASNVTGSQRNSAELKRKLMSSSQLTPLRFDSENHISIMAQSSNVATIAVPHDTERTQESKAQSPMTHRVPMIAQIATEEAEDSSSLLSQQTVINRNGTPPPPPSAQSTQVAQSSASSPPLFPNRKSSVSMQSERIEADAWDPCEANYLDVATLRCLLIRNWSEEGVFWALKYMLNRLDEMRIRREQVCAQQVQRSYCHGRCNSVPAARTISGNRRAADVNIPGKNFNCYLIWSELHGDVETLNRRLINMKSISRDESAKTSIKVAFDEMQPQDEEETVAERKTFDSSLMTQLASSRRISVNTLPAKKMSALGVFTRQWRSRSEPWTPASQRRRPFCSSERRKKQHHRLMSDNNNNNDAVDSNNNANFFPEAIGCASFIERNGHLNLSVLLRAFQALVERSSCSCRVLEMVLNAADALLSMPGHDLYIFFDGLVRLFFRTYLCLGCASGCNEAVCTPQSDFLRVKLRHLLSQMHSTGPDALAQVLRTLVAEMPCQQLLDCVHAMTMFCQPSENEVKCARRRSSMTMTADEKASSNKGIEGMLVSTMLTPLISKLMRRMNELYLPENMSLCQDIRLFVAYVQRNYDNPLRRTALSALTAEISTIESFDESSNSSDGGGGISGRKSLNPSELTVTNARLAPDSTTGSIASCSRDNVSLRRGLFKRKERIDNLLSANLMAPSGVAVPAANDDDSGSGSGTGSGAGNAVEDGGSGNGVGVALGPESSPSTPRNVPSSSIDDGLGNVGSPLLVQHFSAGHHQQKKKLGNVASGNSVGNVGGGGGGGAGKLQFALHLLKVVKNDVSDDDLFAVNTAADEQLIAASAAADDVSIGEDNNSLSVAEQLTSVSSAMCNRLASGGSYRRPSTVVFGGLGAAGKRSSLTAENGAEDKGGVDGSGPTHQLPPYLPPRRLVSLRDVREGARRFSFLLEMCNPGRFPDVPLVAAIAELRSPVLSRAVLMLECIHFVHRCNHNDWPEWTRAGAVGHLINTGAATIFPSATSATMPLNRGTTTTTASSAAAAAAAASTTSPHYSAGGAVAFGGGFTRSGGASRRTFLLQRAAGRYFYAWAVQIALRLQNMAEAEEQQHQDQQQRGTTSEEERRRQLKLSDDLEDFFDDGTVNDATGEGCPPALQLLLCQLLYQITAFLRETFQSIPRYTRAIHKNTSSTTGWEKLMSHRRWSILSNTFNQQQPMMNVGGAANTGSIHSINDLHSNMPERRVSYSTADEESSPRGSRDVIDDPYATSNIAGQFATSAPLMGSEKRNRRLAQGRQRLLKRNSPSSSQTQSQQPTNLSGRKRDSFKIRKISRLASSTTAVQQQSTAHATDYAPFATDDDDADDSSATTPKQRSFAQRRRQTMNSRSGTSRFRMHSMRAPRRSAKESPPADTPPLQRQLPTTSSSGSGSAPSRTTVIVMRAASAAARARETLRPTFGTGSAKSTSSNAGITGGSSTTANATFSPEKRQQQTFQQQYSTATAATAVGPNGGGMFFHSVEDEEEEMIRNMPWINVFVMMANRFDMNCTHESCCSRWCAERVYRQSRRLSDALRVVYEDGSMPFEKRLDRRRQFIAAWQHHQSSKEKRASNPRRESAAVRQSGVERVPLALRGLLMEKLSEIEELRTAAAKRDSQEVNEISSSDLNVKSTPMTLFLRTQMLNLIHSPFSGLLKSAIVMTTDHYKAMVDISWRLLSHSDAHIVSTAAALFICCAVKCAEECMRIMRADMASNDPNRRVQSACRFMALWRNRFHVWLKMEDNAQLAFKVPPPVIDFTLPSPPVGQSQLPVVDPPWMPYIKNKVEELTLKEEEHSTSQTIMTMTRTRRKQKQEMVKRAVREAEERQSELRQQYPLRSTAIVQLSAYEPALFYQQHVILQQQQQQSTQPTSGGGAQTIVAAQSQVVQSQAQQQGQQSQQGNAALNTATQQQQFQENMATIGTGYGDDNDLLAFQQQFSSQQKAQPIQSSSAMSAVLPVAQPLLPSSILSAVPLIIEMFDDTQMDTNGSSVGDICRKICWSCVVEDSSLFLRNFLEKFTDHSKQEHLMSLLRKLILTFRPLPSQMAYTLLNYLFGFIMFYVRSPCEGSDRSMALALSLTWMVAPNVHGLYFKDLKQTLKKEQCDQAIMITANVPAAKKIIVHGPNSTTVGIPSQFPIHEDTQFQQILTDSLDFFNIPEDELDQYFLMDSKTGIFHNPSAYVRDFYFFHRSFYPQLTLLKIDPTDAAIKIRESAFQQKLIEIGKCFLTHSALKYSNVPQRIFFLHDEFTHLPSFPRRSIESCFGMYQGIMGNELQSIDSLHKFAWDILISDMFEKMENAFMFGDLHLFINVINGIMIIHCEDILILRRCMATYISMTIRFNTLFASQGFFLIMPTILRCYSQRQTNRMFTQVVEFVCKQFYILHRKPFLLQMFGSVADIIDHSTDDLEINAMQVKTKYLFNLLLAMENMNELVDQIDILSLVSYPKPLRALDLCYKEDPNTFFILTDAMASCITVCAFAPESKRSYQMLLIMQAMMPCFLKHLQDESTQQMNNASVIRHEITAYTTICVEMRALVNGCEILSRGATRSFDLVTGVSDRGKSFIVAADSPQFFDPPTIVNDDDEKQPQAAQPTSTTQNSIFRDKKHHYYHSSSHHHNIHSHHHHAQLIDPVGASTDNSEMQKEIFRGPRNSLLTLSAMFIVKAGARLKELSKLASNSSEYAIRIPDIFDHKCHAKLSEIAVSLLKIAPYDLTTMSCSGLQKYFLHILPIVDWSVESNRSVLNVVLRRLDKAIVKIAKKQSIRRRANWSAISAWLEGLYQTLVNYPYVAHLHPVKTITQICLRLTVGDSCNDEITTGQLMTPNSTTILNSATPPPAFCGCVLKLTAFLMQALGQTAFSLEYVCGVDGVGPLADCAEAVLCHVLIPLFLRASMPGKEAPQFQARDIAFCLSFMHNAICPPLAKQSLGGPTATSTATTMAVAAAAASAANNNNNSTRDSTAAARQGSVSVTDRGGLCATVSASRIVRDSVVQAVLLALKVMIVAFQKQMTQHWVKVAKIVRELISKKAGGGALYSFLSFLMNTNLPISLIIQPWILAKLNQRIANESEAHWQAEIRELIQPVGGRATISVDVIKGTHYFLGQLSMELRTMKEEFSNRMLEVPHSHTPTIGELHSDSGSSVVSTTNHKPTVSGAGGNAENVSTRRLSSSAALAAKLRSVAGSAKSSGVTALNAITTGLSGSGTVVTGGIDDPMMIPEGTEDELSSSGPAPIMRKSSSAQLSRIASESGGGGRPHSRTSPTRKMLSRSIKYIRHKSPPETSLSTMKPIFHQTTIGGAFSSSAHPGLIRGSLGMFRSVRRKAHPHSRRLYSGGSFSVETEGFGGNTTTRSSGSGVEMPELEVAHHRRAKSLKHPKIVEVTPLMTTTSIGVRSGDAIAKQISTRSPFTTSAAMIGDSCAKADQQQQRRGYDADQNEHKQHQHPNDPLPPTSETLSSGAGSDRPRVVSFSTPKRSIASHNTTTSDVDSEEYYCITSRHHVI